MIIFFREALADHQNTFNSFFQGVRMSYDIDMTRRIFQNSKVAPLLKCVSGSGPQLRHQQQSFSLIRKRKVCYVAVFCRVLSLNRLCSLFPSRPYFDRSPFTTVDIKESRISHVILYSGET